MTENNESSDSQERVIGKKIVLWARESKEAAYKDQFGLPHRGDVVHKEISVTVIKEEKVREWVEDEQEEMDLIKLTAISSEGDTYVSTTTWKWGNLDWTSEKADQISKYRLVDAEIFLSGNPGPFVGKDGAPFKSRDNKISTLLKEMGHPHLS